MIVDVGRWVLHQACSQAARWRDQGLPMAISVNVSMRQLESTSLADHVAEALDASHLDPSLLTLEVTESSIMRNAEATVNRLRRLKELGVMIAIDDFGTGYSSMAYLRQFPVDSLKIDRTFITGFARSGEAHALTHTLIQLGKALGLETLAEGVEERDQVHELQLEGCDLAQGFLFARPLSPEALVHFLEERAATTGGRMEQPAPAQ